MNPSKPFIFLFFLLCAIPERSSAQARIAARLDTTHIYIGAPLRMYITVQAPESARISAPHTLRDSSAVELIDTIRTDTHIRNRERVFTQTWILTAFDSGQFVLPPMPYACTINGKTDTLFTPILAFRAIPMPVDTTKIRTIAPIMDEIFWWSDYKYWFAALFLSTLGVYVFIKIKNRRRVSQIQQAQTAEPGILAHEWAYTALANLEKSGFISKNDEKKHYSELSRIFRIYIERRYDISILEKTSDEILLILENKVENWAFLESNIRAFLQTADLVKFAKANTTNDQNQAFWQIVTHFIDTTKENEQAQNL